MNTRVILFLTNRTFVYTFNPTHTNVSDSFEFESSPDKQIAILKSSELRLIAYTSLVCDFRALVVFKVNTSRSCLIVYDIRVTSFELVGRLEKKRRANVRWNSTRPRA